MKLTYKILIRLSVPLISLLAVWSLLFYYGVMNEVNDEMDDSLEDYANNIMMRALAGVEMPSQEDGTNNSYYIVEITPEVAATRPGISYLDSMVYVKEKDETEPARVIKTIFENREGRFFQLTVSSPSIEKEDLISSISLWIILLFVVILFTVMVVDMVVFRQNLRPLYRLLHWLNHYRVGTPNEPLDNPTEVVEFKQLNEAAENNLQRIEKSYSLQKQFIGNASHEIQTPLAICQNRLEMLMETPLTEEQMGEVVKTLQTLSHIVKLNRSLLFLSKIDNRQFTDSQPQNLNATIKNVLTDFEEAYNYRHIEVHTEESGLFTINMDDALATALVTNLVKNAFVHNRAEGRITIRISADTILFSNTGDSSSLDPERLFQRFYQAGVKREGTTGLGLSIVAAISEMYHLSIAYRFNNEQHQFVLSKK